jgi:CubicO group peptidase (beta-lactamase class C family)
MILSIRNTITCALILLVSAAYAVDLTALPPVLPPAQQQVQPPAPVTGTARIDLLFQGAIAHGLIAGGVILVGDREGTLYEAAYGKVSGEPDARPVAIDTIFDIASLTKVIATTPAILKLAEERRLSLVDPVMKWFPEFMGKEKDELLVMNLLTHTSGLNDFPLASGAPLQSAISGAASQKLSGEIGNRFKYADINFILLGELVHRVSGLSLDRYAAANFFAPLGMNDTSFRPDRGKIPRCAATIGDGKTCYIGVPQDFSARQLGGVAGHAGLFSTARDLARFCRMLLEEGQLAGRRIISERAVHQMTAPYFSRGGQVVRGLGWDRASPFSSPRGNGFSEISFGHTGYTGSSIWIDPAEDIFVVVLTTRLDYKKTREFSQLRGELSTVAAELFAAPDAGQQADRPGQDNRDVDK